MTATNTETGLLSRLSNELADAVETAGNSVVTVNARRRIPASGIAWNGEGLIVTANHVVERDEEITITLPTGEEIPATLVGRDPGADIALLKAETSALPAAPRAEGPARVGNLTLAVGRPGASPAMASFGTVTTVGGEWRSHRGSRVEGFIRADVAMLPGFSGGPLIDGAGGVLGMNTSSLGRGGGLTVPTAAIDTIVAALQSDGKIRRGYLGVGTQPVRLPETMVNTHGLPNDGGLLLVQVEPASPADQAGLLLGDVMIALDGQPVADIESLQDYLSGSQVDQSIAVRILRGGEPRDVQVTIGERG